ncbi:MAG: helix-turn-helix transcriptional regulator [Peptococcaceae bacterium]|nr:helix-turn-helix transcriptional regulator [Peptococcaceae bacterium]
MIRCTLSTVMGKRRLKISDVIRLTGLHRETITSMYYDRKERYTPDLLNKLCKALDCQPGDLLEYVPDENVEVN